MKTTYKCDRCSGNFVIEKSANFITGVKPTCPHCQNREVKIMKNEKK